MAMDETEVLYKIIGLVKEHHKIVTELLSKLALDNAASNSTDPNEALSEILKLHKDTLISMKCLQYAANKSELFDKGQVKGKIYIERLDSTVSLNLLMNIEGLIPFTRSVTQCTDANHKQCFKATKHKCYQERNNKKYIPHTAWKQFHQCRECKQKNALSCCICCSSCKRCGYCNSVLPTDKQCFTYRLVSSLRVLLCFRNFSAHVTKARLKEFLNGNEELQDFPLLKSWDDLALFTKEAYMQIVEFLSKNSIGIEPAYYKAQQDHRIQNILEGTSHDILQSYHRCILEHCQRQENNDDLKAAITVLQRDFRQFIRIHSEHNDVAEENSYGIRRESSRKYNEHEEVDFFYPYITREDSEKLLEDEDSGAYLIRRSTSCTKNFVLTFKQEQRCRHLQVEMNDIYEEFQFVNGVMKERFHTLLVACEEYLKTIQDPEFVPKPYIIQKSDYVETQEEPDGEVEEASIQETEETERQTTSSDSDGREEPPLQRNNDNVEAFSWFFDVDRDGANEILKDENIGTYLLRKSTTYPGGYALVIKDIPKIEHIAIAIRCEGQYVFPRNKTGLIFNSISRAITYYLECWSDMNKLLTQPYAGNK